MTDMKSLKDDLDCSLIDKIGDILGSYENCFLKTVGAGMQQCTGCVVFLDGDLISESDIKEVQIGRIGGNIFAKAKVLMANQTSVGISIRFDELKDRTWIERATGLKLQD